MADVHGASTRHLQHYPLRNLLSKVFKRPNDLAAVDELQAKGCTALVVACHCCLIRDVSHLPT